MRKFKVTVNGVRYDVEVQEEGVVIGSVPVPPVNLPADVASAPAVAGVQSAAPVEVAAGDTAVNAPMPGKIIQVSVKTGDTIKKGDTVVVLEAMKMQNEIPAPVGGTVKSVQVTSGQAVKVGEVMAVIR